MEPDVGGVGSTGPGLVACSLAIALGAWLLASVFIWDHSSTAAFNAFLCGIVIALIGVLSVYMPRTRFLNTGMAVWLAFSAVTFEHHGSATFLNDALVAIAVFAVSLVGSDRPWGVPHRATA